MNESKEIQVIRMVSCDKIKNKGGRRIFANHHQSQSQFHRINNRGRVVISSSPSPTPQNTSSTWTNSKDRERVLIRAINVPGMMGLLDTPHSLQALASADALIDPVDPNPQTLESGDLRSFRVTG